LIGSWSLESTSAWLRAGRALGAAYILGRYWCYTVIALLIFTIALLSARFSLYNNCKAEIVSEGVDDARCQRYQDLV